MPELLPQYNPQEVEEARYQWWEAQGLFHADVDPTRTPYTIVIPPPNITGILHMGHALNNTIQDILIRWKRMQGFNALWVPGTDHAGIATQNVVERALAKEGKTRQDVGREAFVKRVWQWKEQYGATILTQLKRLGASCDWRRTRFTMDEGLSEAVLEVFVRLYEKGLIYRGNYIINWCPRCQTALADEEAPRKETQGKLYHIKYPLDDVSGKFIEVATTRPETMLGDTAIAVHPKDKRYKTVIGKHALLPLVNRKIPIIADEQVNKAFGTGAVKVTPAHDPVDFQLGKKHRLEFINVMTNDAHMTNVPKAYEGLDRFDCRSKLIVDLEQQGFLGAIDEHQHNVGHCYRCNTVVEPRLSPQWFVKMKPLAKPAIEAVKKGKLKFSPERWTKVYLNWMENIEDWCISRQIWWGHRLPVWYCDRCEEVRHVDFEDRPTGVHVGPRVIVSRSRPSKCDKCGNTSLRQDADVLDTWFSSWLWPFSTLGWPKKTKELDYFYPTDTLVTAQEIIFFWVARMVMAGYFCMKDAPFSHVYIHGTVRDTTGKKMSKSLGNIIDPLDIIKQYGTDALRYTLVTATAIGQDLFLSEERFAAGRNFANKLWNATRFVLAAGDAGGEAPTARPQNRRGSRRARTDGGVPQVAGPAAVTVPDRWILSRLQHTVMAVTKSLDAYQFNEAAAVLYDFLWHDFCDWYLEIAKIQLTQAPSPKTQDTKENAPVSNLGSRVSSPACEAILFQVLETSLRLLHPVMPFVTEELWQHLIKPGTLSSIMKAPWPKPVKKLIDDEAESQFERFTAVVGAIRTTRAELNVPPDRRPPVHLVMQHAPLRSFFESQQPLLKTLAGVGDVHVAAKAQKPKDAASTVVDGIEVMLPLAGLIDVEKERARIKQQVDELTKRLQQAEARLNDTNFTEKAPADIVQGARERKQQLADTLKKTTEHLAVLQAM